MTPFDSCPTPTIHPSSYTDRTDALTRLARLMALLSKHTRHCSRLRSSPKDDAVSFFFPLPPAGPVPEVRTHEKRCRSGTIRADNPRSKVSLSIDFLELMLKYVASASKRDVDVDAQTSPHTLVVTRPTSVIIQAQLA